MQSMWFIWSGFATTAVMNVLDFSAVVSQLAGFVWFIAWVYHNVTLHTLVLGILSDMMSLFFRQITVRGVYNIDNDAHSGLVFAVAPHTNQFIDPIVVMKTTTRKIGFLTARKSLNHPMVGPLCRAVDVVPVDRPQDFAKAIAGTVSVGGGGGGADPLVVRGVGTFFTRDLPFLQGEEGSAHGAPTLKVVLGGGGGGAGGGGGKGGAGGGGGQGGSGDPRPSGKSKGGSSAQAVVEAILSDTELRLAAPLTLSTGAELQLSGAGVSGARAECIPKLDHTLMWRSVYDRLRRGGAIGLFPEGGSHDQAHLLPLKVGVAAAALGACAGHPDLTVKIVPVGLNYFSGHRFRSRVYVDYGDPVDVSRLRMPPEPGAADRRGRLLSEAFAEGGEAKRRACALVMEGVKQALSTVTVEAEDKDALELFWMLRRLYVPKEEGSRLTMDEKIALSRGFAAGYEHVKDDPAVQAMMRHARQYNEGLKAWGIKDHQVATVGDQASRNLLSVSYTLYLLTTRCLLLAVYVAVSVPGLLLASPCIVITRYVAYKKAAAAVRGSTVKKTGLDVAATWKVLVAIVLVPVLHITYTSVAYAWCVRPPARSLARDYLCSLTSVFCVTHGFYLLQCKPGTGTAAPSCTSSACRSSPTAACARPRSSSRSSAACGRCSRR